ncbi:tryptophan synthase beta subunit-like PLP-dependent enzyme [Chytriomyces sp. MP71]|nr:tryptophan synthase beta subunit-like PLP-dependent enzyme [Chytriomyces sp. MP71]
MPPEYAISSTDVTVAHGRIRPHIHETPILTNAHLNRLASTDMPRALFLKCENLQKVGAFKFRGAMNALLQIREAHVRTGGVSVEAGRERVRVATHSSGNHAQAIALAARLLGMHATIVMPSTAPKTKVSAVIAYGADVVFCEPNQRKREEAVEKVVKETGAVFVHPYQDARVMAGQGTLMLELLDQVETGRIVHHKPDAGPVRLDAVLVPVGGGGMLSGCAVVAAASKMAPRVFAAEPLAVDDCARGFALGARQTMQAAERVPIQTVADGLMTTIGEPNWPIIRDHVEAVFTVSEEEIVEAMRLVFERVKLVIEPSAAVGVAVALFNKEFKKLKGVENVGIVLCGGNLDLDKELPWVGKLAKESSRL